MELIQPGLGLIFWMTVAFGLILFVLGKYAWKPIMKMLHEREHAIDSALHEADKAREEMKQLKVDNEKLLKEAKEEHDVILAEARKIKDKMIEDARVKAGQEAQRIVDSAKERIENEKMAALVDLKNEIASLSIEIAEKVVKTELAEEKKHEELIQRLIKEIKIN